MSVDPGVLQSMYLIDGSILFFEAINIETKKSNFPNSASNRSYILGVLTLNFQREFSQRSSGKKWGGVKGTATPLDTP